MSTSSVVIVRVYLTERKASLRKLLSKLHDEECVRGVTVFRGVAGFGKSGTVHSSSLLDLATDLPLVVEFFDTPEKIAKIIPHLTDMVDPGHIVSWPAEVND